jgi:hypothetical protein
MQRGYSGIAGRPVKPYPQYSVNYSSDVWLTLTFLDRTNTAVTPSAISYRIDNLTSFTVVLTDTSVTPTGTTQTLNIPGALNIFSTDIGQSSQLFQITVTVTYPGGSVAKEVFPYEVISIQTVGGAGP